MDDEGGLGGVFFMKFGGVGVNGWIMVYQEECNGCKRGLETAAEYNIGKL